MKLFGKGRKKANDHVVENVELEEGIKLEIETEELEESPEMGDVQEVTSNPGESVEESEVTVTPEESVVKTDSVAKAEEPEVTEGSEVTASPEESVVKTESEAQVEEPVVSERSDTDKTLEELDAEVEEEVRRTALLPVDEINEAIDATEDSLLEVTEEPTEEVTEKVAKKKRIRKIILGTIGGILATILLVYAAGTAYFHYNFFYNTTMNGMDVSLKSVQAIHTVLEEKVEAYTLTMITAEGTEEIIQGSTINIGYKKSNDVATALDLQMAYKWPIMFFKDRQFIIDVEITFNEDILMETLNKMDVANPKEVQEPINAYPAYSGGKVRIVEEVYGNILAENIGEILIQGIYNLQEEMVLMDVNAYLSPEITSNSPEVIVAKETMETYLNAEINYNEGDLIDSELIGLWLVADPATLEVSLDSDQISGFVEGLENKYNTYSNSITFTNPVGKKVTVTGGSYGDRVNASSEVEQIVKDITSGANVSRAIKYSQKSASNGSADSPFGDTYVCLDLTLQKVYLLYKGSVILTSDCVTGNVAAGNATPQGVYYLSYKTKNAVLRGSIQSDGSYGYESPVSYWMPFNGGIGFHDASWRSTYGGSIYKTNGSHGCVNMPLANAEKLYQYINTSMPIVCHY